MLNRVTVETGLAPSHLLPHLPQRETRQAASLRVVLFAKSVKLLNNECCGEGANPRPREKRKEPSCLQPENLSVI
jgi:hypothetical protein